MIQQVFNKYIEKQRPQKRSLRSTENYFKSDERIPEAWNCYYLFVTQQ
jgi:hypothetical protein